MDQLAERGWIGKSETRKNCRKRKGQDLFVKGQAQSPENI
jgi:hypothetical protein